MSRESLGDGVGGGAGVGAVNWKERILAPKSGCDFKAKIKEPSFPKLRGVMTKKPVCA